jgi:hypothetical protein
MAESFTPNLNMPLLDPSQSQPEVKINESLGILDTAIGTGIVSSVGLAPATASSVVVSGATSPITGSGVFDLALSGDVTSPGDGYFYGTNSSGVKGWYAVAAPGTGTVTSVALAAGSSAVTASGTVTTSGSLTVDLSTTSKADLALAATALQAANVADSITVAGGNLQLSGDTASPGNSYLYGTNSSGTKGWYAQPAGSGGSASSVALAAAAASSVVVSGSASPITASGTFNLALSGDSTSPGNTMLYGTNGSGAKGWYAQPSGGGSLELTDGTHDLTAVTKITVTGATVGGTSSAATLTVSGGSAVAYPGTVSDLVLWFESDNIIGTNGSGVSRIGDRVPWVGGCLAANLTGSAVITVDSTQINGLNVLKFPAATACYTIGSPVALPSGCSIFCVIKPQTTGAQCIVGSATSNGISVYLSSGTQSVNLTKTYTAVVGTSTATWTVGTPFQFNITYNATTGAYAFRQSRTAANSGTGAAGAGSVGALAYIGQDDGSSGLLNNASLAALIVFNRVLTSTEVTNMENYLYAKWGV